MLSGQVSAGLVMGTGALNVSFSDGKDPYQQRARPHAAGEFLLRYRRGGGLGDRARSDRRYAGRRVVGASPPA